MPARSKVMLLQHALEELGEEHEMLTRKYEQLTRENATIRAKVKVLEGRIAELESGRPPAPKKRGRP